MNQSKSAADIHRRIRESAGAEVLNRAHMRTFSFNVFEMNAIELIEAVHRVKDPGQGVQFMMSSNRDVGTQAHRELNRHVHNFVSSALTLVEHTRIHMRKHYEDTDFMATYNAQVVAMFAQSPAAQFVQGLRNYMLHRGLPNSTMFMKFTTAPGATDGSGTVETGIKISTASLMEWDGWKPAARTYIANAGEALDIQDIAQEYWELAAQFQQWLEVSLADYHQHELKELNELSSDLEAADPADLQAAASAPLSISVSESASDFTSWKIDELDKIALGIFEKIRELRLREPFIEFPSEREAVTITDQDLVEPAVYWGQTESGTNALSFIQQEGKSFGLTQTDYESLDGLFAYVKKAAWARDSISDEFIEEVFIGWARDRFQSGVLDPFSADLKAIVRKKVMPVEVWAPIAHMEVEEAFVFGPVSIEPVTVAMMDRLATMMPPEETGRVQKGRELLDDIKRKFKGSAAVLVTLTAEPMMAQGRALQLAQDAVALLRFFSDPAATSYLFSPVSLSGSEYTPIARLMVIHDDGLVYSERTLPKHIVNWRLSKRRISELFQAGLLVTAGSLVVSTGLSEFALAVRASLLTYSKSTTFVDPLDRLKSCVSSVEGVFLKHELEPRVHSIANRMALLFGDAKCRELLKQMMREVYWLQEQPSHHHLHRTTEELIFRFTTCAYEALSLALHNIANFESKSQFLSELDRGGQTSD